VKTKLWLRIFFNLLAIIFAFAILIVTANGLLLTSYYQSTEKSSMINAAKRINGLNLETSEDYNELVRISLESKYSVVISKDGTVVFPVPSFDRPASSGLMVYQYEIAVEEIEIIDKHTKFFTGKDKRSNSDMYVIEKTLDNTYTLTLATAKTLIDESARIANQFILIVLFVCLVVALAWAIVFARRFSKPVSEMNKITKNMASLDFSQRLVPESRDEIGELGNSINALSAALDSTLHDLSLKNQRLEHEIQRERTLDSMRKGFVANVSHELKTPISIIQGYAEGLKLGVTDSVEEYCDVIIDESSRMNRLVLDLIELSKYESGSLQLDKKYFNMNGLVGEVLSKMHSSFEAAGIRPKLDISPDFDVFADSMRIEQVLSNFLNNALSHVGEKKIIAVYSREENGQNWLYVYNSDSHINDEDMEQIWQSFYRGDKSHKRNEGRFGLGLSIVKAIVELHSGVVISGNTEEGVIFGFTLP